MEGQGGYTPEQNITPEIKLQDGLRAYPLPDFTKPDRFGQPEPVSKEEAETKLNAFLTGIQQQGGDLKGFVSMDVNLGSLGGGVRGKNIRPQQFAVVAKAPQQ